MDFGVVGVDGVVGSDIGFGSLASDNQTKPKWYGSGSLKQEGSGNTEGDWRSTKLAKTDDFSTSKAMLLHQQRNAAALRSNASVFFDGQQQQHMLSFSSPKPEVLLVDKNSQNAALPYSYQSVSPCTRTTGYSSASLNGASMHGVLSGPRGPFTPSQWIELEHQALIYKYFTADVPVPSNLLVPIKKALESTGVCSYSGGLLRPNSLGWGSFHLGFSSNADPEPGRCRRTDGKKWRCSRDAVPDQKYCERHMNRGRHRSRKHVEGQSGHAVTATTTTTSKLLPNTSSSHMSTMIDGGSSDITFARQAPSEPHKGSVPGSTNGLFVSSKLNASEKKQDTPSLSMFSSAMELKSKGNSFLINESQYPCEESSRTQFGLVTSESLLNPSQKETPQSIRYFIDDWPKNPSDRCSLSWQDVDTQTERTQLSISIPMPPSDFSKSISTASNEQLKLSSLRHSCELEPMHEGLGLGSSNVVVSESCNTSQANWIPIRWESSMGGPLGEALQHSNNGNECRKNYSGLNLMTDGWGSSSPLGSSPTGVLQKTTFRSLSNSTASSPRSENRKQDGASLCNDLLGSTLGNSSSFSAL